MENNVRRTWKSKEDRLKQKEERYFQNSERERNRVHQNSRHDESLKDYLPLLVLLREMPRNTQESDIISSFSKFGFTRIHWINNTSCAVALSSPTQVEEAVSHFRSSSSFIAESLLKSKHNLPSTFYDSLKKYLHPLPPLTVDEETSKLYDEMILATSHLKEVNPPLVITEERVGGKTLHIVRDDLLIGGTKQRALVPILKSHKAKEFVYAGPVQGYAQVALSYAAKLGDKKATLFLNKMDKLTPLSQLAKDLGGNLQLVPNGYLARVQEEAEAYTKRVKREKGDEYIELFPFGLLTTQFVVLLKKQLEKAIPSSLMDNPPKRLWLVVGSGTIIITLSLIWPKTHFLAVQVGKKVNDVMLKGLEYTLYVAPEKFDETARVQPPYPSVSNYDAKLWQFVLQHGQDGDYVWNVGKDVSPSLHESKQST